MSRKLLILLLLLIANLAQSQNLEWKTDMTEAINVSNEQRKPMLILFTAAGAAEALQNEVFKTADFEKWSRKNVILVKLDLSDPNIASEVREQSLMLKNAFGVVNLPEVCYASATLRKGKTNFNTLGKLTYSSGGVNTWITNSNLILNPEE
ncbi:thioredoxin family protein [Flavobacterium ginsengiterrae]|uniref:Protein disulfide-isomerase n=1 Tax=Flavobacterium ginsengiterrae TaxID=871695 RepID=A0ABP7GHJ3_9FLAO